MPNCIYQTEWMYSAGMITAVASEVPQFVRLADHPLRWRLLTELAASDQRVRELVERLGEPQNLVSYHLRLLREGGLVTARRSSHDGRDTYYHLDLDRCADGLAWSGAALHPGLRMAALPPDQPNAAAPTVLFVCTGNSARSPMAEALLRHHTGGRVSVASAGISPKTHIHPHAVAVLRERFDIDIHGQAPRAIDDVAGPGPSAAFDRVVTLCDKAREHLPERDGWRRTHWSVPDPADTPGRARYASFASTATDIDARVRHLIPTLDNRR
jgi:ArsR family transcriptional regulator, arsenate/arsenite/antimonite-responsive transcriptional repressor / arsenate reductase (thioredoxin)